MISVVVLNWNGREYLEECLSSLLAQSYDDYEIIVVDNGSADGSVEYIKDNFPTIRLKALTTNLGFDGGVNAGIKESRGDLVFLLNNDTSVDSHCLARLADAALKYKDAASFAVKLLFEDGQVINAAGDRYYAYGRAENIGFKEPDSAIFDKGGEVFSACAGAALYRKDILVQAGFFDEDFFLLLEDIDVGFRLQLMGHTCRYVPDAKVFHHHSRSIGQRSPLMAFYTAKNDMHLLVKNMPLSLFIKNLLRIFLHQQRYLRYNISLGLLWPHLKGELKGLLELPRMLTKRYRILKLRRSDTARIDSILGEGRKGGGS